MRIFSVPVLLFSLVMVSSPSFAEEKEWKELLDGKSLEHWEKQPEPGIHGTGGNWGVSEDGVLYGEQDPPGSGEGGLLLTKEEFEEFELEISLKPDWGPDSGIFIRTNDKGEGWQIYVDHHDRGNVGHLRLETKKYSVPFRPFGFSRIDPEKPELAMEPDSRTGNWPEDVYEETCTAEEWLATWKTTDWNRMRIRCTGDTEFPVIEVWIEDLKVCRLDTAKTMHPDFDKAKAMETESVRTKGHIGLQVHRGKNWPNGARVWWKEIRIKEL